MQATLREHAVQEVLNEGVYDLLMGRGPLQLAARLGNVDALQLLLDAGAAASLDVTDGNGLTALQVPADHQRCQPCNTPVAAMAHGGRLAAGLEAASGAV